MAENTEYTPLPADLPEDWTPGQIVAPAGADAGLSVQHGYNYLNKQVNDAQRAVNRLQEDAGSTQTDVDQLQTDVEKLQGDLEAVHGLPDGGTVGQVLGKTGEEDGQAGWINLPDTGVTSFKGRKGTVQPASGDYSVSQVTGAASTASPVFTGSISLGRKSGSSTGYYSTAFGSDATASGFDSHAEGTSTVASGSYAHAEGRSCVASGDYAHAQGNNTQANGNFSFSGGSFSNANGDLSVAFGFNTIANDSQFVIGQYNTISTDSKNVFIAGKGSGNTSRANCFRINFNGVYGIGAWNASGADYAELFEWADGNLDKQDRVGLFVTLQGDRIRIASPDDDYVLGIVSGSPSVVGDVYDDQWQGMSLTDIFGRPVYEDVELPAELGPDGEVILPARTERRQKLNPAYNNAEKYVPRTQRPEWDAVGLLGKLVAVDDGTCVPDGWCTVGPGGMATASKERTEYRVMARLDESHVRVMIL